MPLRGERGSHQDPLRVATGRDDKEEQGSARALLPEGLPPVVGAPGPGEGGRQVLVGPAARCVCGPREGGVPGWLPGDCIAHRRQHTGGKTRSFLHQLGRAGTGGCLARAFDKYRDFPQLQLPGVDVGRSVGRVQGRVPSMRRRVAELRLLGYSAKRPHGGGRQLEVAVTAGNNDFAGAGAQRRVLQDGVLGRRPIGLVQQHVAVVGGRLGKPEGVLGVPKTFQGHQVDCLSCIRREPCGRFVVRMRQEGGV